MGLAKRPQAPAPSLLLSDTARLAANGAWTVSGNPAQVRLGHIAFHDVSELGAEFSYRGESARVSSRSG